MVFAADLYEFALTTVHIQYFWWACEGENVPEMLLNMQLSVSILHVVVVHLPKEKAILLLEKGTK